MNAERRPPMFEQTVHRIVSAFAATLFALVLIVAILVLGGHSSRVAALAATLFAVISQFSAQDLEARRFHIAVSYLGFAMAVLAIAVFAYGL